MRFHSSVTPSLLLAVAVLSGCGGSAGSGSAPTTLFTDDFSGALGAKWIDVSYPGATATSGDADTLGSPSHGNPSPGLWLKGASNGTSPGGGGGVRTTATFASSPLTFAADARYDSGPQDPAGNFLMVTVNGINDNAIKAGALILPSSVRYWLYQGATLREVTQPATADGAFHRFTLTIDVAGNATWHRDGALQQSIPGFPAVTLYARAMGPGSTNTVLGSGSVDNVLVTTP
jgi:hypothetical protein